MFWNELTVVRETVAYGTCRKESENLASERVFPFRIHVYNLWIPRNEDWSVCTDVEANLAFTVHT